MTSWEERMADRAREREAAREAAIPRDENGERLDDPHRGHHSHLDGTAVYCSCGEFRGVTTVAFPDWMWNKGPEWTWFIQSPYRRLRFWWSVRCRVCGKHGVASMGG